MKKQIELNCGCGEMGMETEYFLHNRVLWHISCAVQANLHWSGKPNLTKEESDRQFIETMLENNKILKDNFDNRRMPELEKFIKSVLLKKGIDESLARRILTPLIG